MTQRHEARHASDLPMLEAPLVGVLAVRGTGTTIEQATGMFREDGFHRYLRKWFAMPLLLGFAVPSCAFDSSTQPIETQSVVECSNGPNECPKIDTGSVGDTGVSLEVDGVVVTFVSFEEKDDDGGYIGFTLDTEASFVVKAGNTCYAGEGSSWTHPAGTSGPDAKAISNVQICSAEEPEPYCGDGNLDEGEECDDGNMTDGDGCSANCTLEPFCGDGNLDDGEECDDGNMTDGDGCSANCTFEPFCGDGNLDDGEECDDGNMADGDGCSAECLTETET